MDHPCALQSNTRFVYDAANRGDGNLQHSIIANGSTNHAQHPRFGPAAVYPYLVFQDLEHCLQSRRAASNAYEPITKECSVIRLNSRVLSHEKNNTR